MELYRKKGILHRDVSIHNILLGTSSAAEPGYHGTLIDFNMAIHYNIGTANPEDWLIVSPDVLVLNAFLTQTFFLGNPHIQVDSCPL